MKHLTLFLITILSFSCVEVTKTQVVRNATSTASTTTTYSCSYYSLYDDLSTCQTTTLANCDFEWKTFPSGAIGACYKPFTGWETCSITTTSWTYSTWGTWCDTGTVDGGANKIYKSSRSVIGCSSNTCACLSAQTLSRTCSTATTACATVDASFNPLVAPTPAPCP